MCFACVFCKFTVSNRLACQPPLFYEAFMGAPSCYLSPETVSGVGSFRKARPWRRPEWPAPMMQWGYGYTARCFVQLFMPLTVTSPQKT